MDKHSYIDFIIGTSNVDKKKKDLIHTDRYLTTNSVVLLIGRLQMVIKVIKTVLAKTKNATIS
jgi:hypothetical protein